MNEPNHPAKYSKTVIEAMDEIIGRWRGQLPVDDKGVVRLLDPFAGVGRCHQLADTDLVTTGIELEPEFAAGHEWNEVGDACDLRFDGETFGVVATSPSYGNRMADQYLGEPCPDCVAEPDLLGSVLTKDCLNCDGSGRKPTRRYGYAISLGRKCSEGSGASLQWGDEYRALHGRAATEMRRVLRPGGLLILNMSDHLRSGKRQHVTRWWVDELHRVGLSFIEGHTVSTSRMGHGANSKARVDGEQVLVFWKPV